MTLWGLMGVASMSVLMRADAFSSFARPHHSSNLTGLEPRAHISALRALAASAWRFTHWWPCFPNSVGSMSMWMTLPDLMRSWGLYVLSENLLPMEIMRSASADISTAASLPWSPSGPRFIGYDDGTAPMPIRVVATGAPIADANSMTSAEASMAPPPTRISGLLASRIHWTASWMPDRSSRTGFMP